MTRSVVARLLPVRPLAQIRAIMLAVAFFYTVPLVYQPMVSANVDWYTKAEIAGAFVGVSLTCAYMFVSGRATWASDALLVVFVIFMTVVSTKKMVVVQALYMAAAMRPLYGGTWRRFVTTTVTLVTAYVAPMVGMGFTAYLLRVNLTDFLSLAVTAAMVRLMWVSLNGEEEALRRSRVLEDAGRALLAASDPGEVFQVLRRAASSLAFGLRNTQVGLTLIEPAERSFAVTREVWIGGRQVLLTLSSSTPIPGTVKGDLEGLAEAGSMALERFPEPATHSAA